MNRPETGERRVALGKFRWATTTRGDAHIIELEFFTPEGYRPSRRAIHKARRIVEAMARELLELPGARGARAQMSQKALEKAHRRGRTRLHTNRARG